jgi:hypothetical protein
MRSTYLRFIFRLALVAVVYGGVVTHSMAQAAAGGPGGGGAGAGGGGGGGAGAGGGGASGGGGGGGGGGGAHTNPNPVDPGPTDSTVESLSQETEKAIEECDVHTSRCIADILDNYATGLRALTPRLPPEFRTLPRIVESAATKVRTARTRKEAVRAVADAIAQVHKSIALLRADDPTTLKAETREGSFVVETLQAADDKLEKAVGL